MTPRADAQRNRDALVAAADEVFAEQGANFSFEEVARQAGVGKGTLYRHFATREYLIAALLQSRFDDLEREALDLVDSERPMVAVETWLRDFDRYPARSRGLSMSVGEGLADASSAVSSACAGMKAGFEQLATRAKESGDIRSDVDVPQLLSVVASLPEKYRREDGSSPFLDTILAGLRA
jgi:AcrR family transcriptional regulator